MQDSDVDDIVQEVLLTVARELPAFEHSGRTGAFRKWLRTILVDRLKNFWKTRNRRPSAPGGSSLFEQLQELEDETSSASRIWDAEYDQHVLALLLEQIRPRFQESTWEAFRRQMFRGEKGTDRRHRSGRRLSHERSDLLSVVDTSAANGVCAGTRCTRLSIRAVNAVR